MDRKATRHSEGSPEREGHTARAREDRAREVRAGEDWLRRRLLAWYDKSRRDLPWRAGAGESADPYAVWISEIMLQQTTVVTVIPYYEAFLGRWPTVEALAAAPLDDVLHAWTGLGYYARARNLHAAARAIVRDWGGRFPSTEGDLRSLPGVGAYTAAAIAAIAFGVPTTPVDGNVVRVLARLDAIDAPLPRARDAIDRRARALAPPRRAGDFAQALMDLGATICRPRQPLCLLCPWHEACAAHAEGRPETLPVRPARSSRPMRYGVAFWVESADGAVLFRRRPEKGLLGGMMEIPSTAWRSEPWPLAEALAAAPFVGRWEPLTGTVAHIFTHFHLVLTILRLTAVDATAMGATAMGTTAGGTTASAPGIWVQPNGFDGLALPTLMRKIATHVQATPLQATLSPKPPAAVRPRSRAGPGTATRRKPPGS